MPSTTTTSPVLPQGRKPKISPTAAAKKKVEVSEETHRFMKVDAAPASQEKANERSTTLPVDPKQRKADTAAAEEEVKTPLEKDDVPSPKAALDVRASFIRKCSRWNKTFL